MATNRQKLHPRGAQVIAESVSVPISTAEKVLHTVGVLIAGVLGQLPAVLPFDVAEESL
jgi:hypothetical protein